MGKKRPVISAEWRKTLALIPGYDSFATAEAGDWFDETAAQRACDFFEHPEDGCLRHIEGTVAGELFILEPWERAIIGALFGWKRADGTRRYRNAFIYVPRKNGKTPLAAGIALHCLFCDGERGAQIYCAAAEREQAALLYRHARGMVEQEPELSSRCRVYAGVGQRAIQLHDDSASVFKVLSADADTKHGGNPHVVIVDELHAQPNRELVDVLCTSMASANRRQPLLVYITTADYDRESICNELHGYAIRVRDGALPDRTFLPVVYEATAADDWGDEELWRRVNPNLGVSVSLDYLRQAHARAKEQPAFENTFRRFHLNQKTQQDVRWLPIERWDECATEDLGELENELCFAALDLSSTQDVTALALVFPGSKPWRLKMYYWVPADNAHQREKRDRVPYETWAREGRIELTPGNVVDYEFIRKRVNELSKIHRIQQVAIDRKFAMHLITLLMGDGFDLAPFGQGFLSMSPAMKEMERLIVSRGLLHEGCPVMRWMMGNVAAEMNAPGDIKPSKAKSTERIDGPVAAIMAVGRAIAEPVEGPSVYEERGLLII